MWSRYLVVCYHAAKSILDDFKTTEVSLGQTKIKRVAIVQFRMNKCCGYCGCSFKFKTRLYATEVTNVIEAGVLRAVLLLWYDKLQSTMRPRFLAKWTWCQTDISSKWNGMTGEFGKLLRPADAKKFLSCLDFKPAGLQTSSWMWNERRWRVQTRLHWGFQVWMKCKAECHQEISDDLCH